MSGEFVFRTPRSCAANISTTVRFTCVVPNETIRVTQTLGRNHIGKNFDALVADEIHTLASF